MKKKCLFFDIDGTLVDEQTHQIPQSTIEALQAARRRVWHLLEENRRDGITIDDSVWAKIQSL